MSKNANEHILNHELLAKYFSGNAAPKDAEVVDNWVKENDGNSVEFEKLKQLWKETGTLPNAPIISAVETHAAWESVRENITGKSDNVIPISKKNKTPWLSIAASLILLVAVGTVLSVMFSPSAEMAEMKVVKTLDQTTAVTLSDGSVVTLNKNSSFEYPEEFGAEERKVVLKGEAFFSVAHNAEKPFIVAAEKTEIKVLGTEFNLYSKADSVSVYLESGKIQFSEGAQKLILAPGESAAYSPKAEEIESTSGETLNPTFWKSKKLNYNSVSLAQVVQELSMVYGKNIVLASPEIGKCEFTSTFKNESLETILEVLSMTFQLSVEETDNIIILNGKGC